MAQKNKIKALESVFGDDAKEMVKGLRRLSPEEYQKVLSNHSLPSINYMYSDEEYDNALEKVKSMYVRGSVYDNAVYKRKEDKKDK